VIDIHNADNSLPVSMLELLALGDEGLERVAEATAKASGASRKSVKILAPVPHPEKVICIGLNYADHAAESGVEAPSEPVVFNKFASALAADGDPIVLPAISQKVDYEAELVVVIGRGGRGISRDDAWQHIAGYACGHDVSARDWQLEKPGGQWLQGKSFDTFAPLGPYLVTRDEVPDPGNLSITLRLNGEVMQDSNTGQLIFPIPHLIEHLSAICTLAPGDVIYTGTPPGVGMARTPPVYLKDGDSVEVEIQQLGVLRNPVTAEPPAEPPNA
jgi:2-keto-4-pentenoate hydratase/2-oxohepta-3-ene-1,7-dioic acid hydratase in catechol pathway